MTDDFLSSLVWTDYRMAVLFTVFFPLGLLIWAWVGRQAAIGRLLIIYWRVASLLGVTVYLMIAALPVAFLTGWLARVLIPAGLWFWVDLNEEIAESRPGLLKLALTSWRWAITFYCLLGASFGLWFLPCGFRSQSELLASQCRLWLEPPWAYRLVFHSGYTPGFLGFLGLVGLLVYTLYFGHFLVFRLRKQGRMAGEL